MTDHPELREALRHLAPDQVHSGPTLDEMAHTVERRRRRNRAVAGLGAMLIAGMAIVGAVIAVDETPDVVATADQPTAQETVDDDSTDADPAESSEAKDPAPADLAPDEQEPVNTDSLEADDDTPDADVSEAQADPETPRVDALQLDVGSAITVETSASAVSFAAGSGVHVHRVQDEWRGVASSFGGSAGIRAIGLRSSDGLAWEEVDVTGLPAGATVSVIRRAEDGFVALVSSFDIDAQKMFTFVATSADLVEWSVAPALPVGDAVPTDLTVSSGTVWVVGDGASPVVWNGPLGGPYAPIGRIADAQSIVGVVPAPDGVVAAGVGTLGNALFVSTDGITWSENPLSMTNDDDPNMGRILTLSTAGDALVLAGGSSDVSAMSWTATSVDGGATWARVDLGDAMVDSAAASTGGVGMLGSSGNGSTVTLASADRVDRVELDLDPGTRIELLAADDDEVILLADTGAGPVWVRASR